MALYSIQTWWPFWGITSYMACFIYAGKPCAVKSLFTASLKCLQLVFVSAKPLECSVCDAVTFCILMLTCPVQHWKRPRVVRQNVEDHVSAESLLRFSYFPVITSMIQLRNRIPQSWPDYETSDWQVKTLLCEEKESTGRDMNIWVDGIKESCNWFSI